MGPPGEGQGLQKALAVRALSHPREQALQGQWLSPGGMEDGLQN